MKLLLQTIGSLIGGVFTGIIIVIVFFLIANAIHPIEAQGRSVQTVRQATLGDSQSIKPEFESHMPSSQILSGSPVLLTQKTETTAVTQQMIDNDCKQMYVSQVVLLELELQVVQLELNLLKQILEL